MIRNRDIPFLYDPVEQILIRKKDKSNTREEVIKHATKFTSNYVLEKTLSVIRYELGMRRKVLESMMAAESQSTGKNQKNL